MPVEFHTDEKNIVDVTVSGTLTKEDYASFIPAMEQAIEKHSLVRIIFRMKDFHGWELGAAWEDLKFDIKHHSDIVKIAMVGENRWEKWMSSLCKPFTSAKVQYFPEEHIDQAQEWIRD